MRLISPALPGTAFLLSAAAEVSVLLAQGQAALHEVVPLWVQMIPVAIVFGIGGWGLIRLFQHERDTAANREADKKANSERFAALEEKIEKKGTERHEENVKAISSLAQKLDQMTFVLMGIQGQGGLMEDRAKNQERRHELAQDITLIYAHLHYFGIWAAKVGEARGVPFDPPPMEKPRRRRGESGD